MASRPAATAVLLQPPYTTVSARIQVAGSIFRLVRIHRMRARACYRPLERRTAACALPRVYPTFFPSPTPLRKVPCTGSRLKRLSGHEGWESRRTRLSPYPSNSSSLHYSVTCTAISCGSSVVHVGNLCTVLGCPFVLIKGTSAGTIVKYITPCFIMAKAAVWISLAG